MAETWDLLIRGANVFDGTGAAPRRLDVAVSGERIAALGELEGGAGVVVDASGLALAPGFIDVHSHDDFAVLLNPEMDFKLMQGVTTDVVGNCGMGAAPFEAGRVFAQIFHPGRTLPDWTGYARFMDAIASCAASLNVAVLLRPATLRAAAMGADKRAPDPAELGRMRADLREGLEAGAVGFSTGLIYEPGRHARTAELIELAREMRDVGGLYATHMRDEGAGLLDSIRETLEIGESGGVPVQISHHKAAGRENWGLVGDSLRLIETAARNGLDVTADQYPYTRSSTVLAAIASGLSSDAGGVGRASAEDVWVASSPGHPDYEGRTIGELAKRWRLDPRAAAERVLSEEPGAFAVMLSMDEADVCTVMQHPTTMIGSDGIPTEGGKPHPRLYGTFARVLGRYVREQGLLRLEEAVNRMTGLPAAKFGLVDRGEIRPGAWADMVLFDPETVLDTATYEDPRRYPDGIRDVFVNGVAVVRDGAHTGARPGRVLRRGQGHVAAVTGG